LRRSRSQSNARWWASLIKSLTRPSQTPTSLSCTLVCARPSQRTLRHPRWDPCELMYLCVSYVLCIACTHASCRLWWCVFNRQRPYPTLEASITFITYCVVLGRLSTTISCDTRIVPCSRFLATFLGLYCAFTLLTQSAQMWGATMLLYVEKFERSFDLRCRKVVK